MRHHFIISWLHLDLLTLSKVNSPKCLFYSLTKAENIHQEFTVNVFGTSSRLCAFLCFYPTIAFNHAIEGHIGQNICASTHITFSLFVSLSSVSVYVCTGMWTSLRIGHRGALPGQIQTGHARVG